MTGFTIYYELKHHITRRWLVEFGAALKKTDADYLDDGITNITKTNSELIAVLQAIIKQVKDYSIEDAMDIRRRLK